MVNYPNLLAPVSLGQKTLKNRIAMAPMSRGRAGPTLCANDLVASYYAARASAGLIITEGSHTSILGRGWYHTPEIFTDDHAAGWKIVTDKVHQNDGVIFCQLWHAGRASHSAFRDGEDGFDQHTALSVAPSAVKKFSESGLQSHTPRKGSVPVETPRELTVSEIEALPQEFRNAAEKAKKAGFDGVELHCAGGFLLETFLQACSNKRTDEYGGNFENQFRIVDMVLKQILEVFEPHQVGVKISPNSSYNGMGGPDVREAFLYYVRRLKEYKLGYLHIAIGLQFGWHGHGEPMTLAEIRAVYPGVIIGNMGFDAASGEKEIAEGNADMISFGRAFLSNPDLVEKIAEAKPLRDALDFRWWYTSVEEPLTSEGYTDLSVVDKQEVPEEK